MVATGPLSALVLGFCAHRTCTIPRAQASALVWNKTVSQQNHPQNRHDTKPPSTKTRLPSPSMTPITALDASIDHQLRGLRSLKGLLAKTSTVPEADSASLPQA
ncbi:hypothetical protein V8F33_012234 [Rhypophila sp. PSN 637]